MDLTSPRKGSRLLEKKPFGAVRGAMIPGEGNLSIRYFCNRNEFVRRSTLVSHESSNFFSKLPSLTFAKSVGYRPRTLGREGFAPPS